MRVHIRFIGILIPYHIRNAKDLEDLLRAQRLILAVNDPRWLRPSQKPTTVKGVVTEDLGRPQCLRQLRDLPREGQGHPLVCESQVPAYYRPQQQHPDWVQRLALENPGSLLPSVVILGKTMRGQIERRRVRRHRQTRRKYVKIWIKWW